ncbi:SGNH/GDSL hydrolase family protein [Ferruginibacter sp. HRS2-29]|uniref:SGNH/GDSL hydrolase family protein n=1 Tax=Ferruginibacter sp. HRS2-29 TaxID=2487334 RepID=UPI0020CD91F2|nr:SGNH/GDSL hydrolase family protein [Ferruginibacter sp. HRS2-29]MCP9750417.1 SGNH/GDSL hydrolase family protein [Ferruginibacter sp. HRS2-29]
MKTARSILFFSAIALLALSCKKNDTSVATVDPIPGLPSLQKNFLALGDSYTIGQGVPAPDRFPAQTKEWLKNEGIDMADPKYVATTGWTTADLSAGILAADLKNNYNVVTLLIGVNDQYMRQDTIGYRERFTTLLKTSIGFAGRSPNRVFVLSIPDYSVTPAAGFSDTAFIRKQIELFNKINREVSVQYFCNYLDITPSTRDALNDRSLICPDSLHPSGKEYARWAARLGPMMKLVLQ